jgi:uncharacterized repeat protein (TIGR02543 family)
LITYIASTPATYTVTFDSQSGTPTPNPITGIASGATVTLPADPTQTGYTFNGWFTATTGGTAFTAATPVTADMIVYAQWTPVTYTIVVTQTGNGTIAPDTQTGIASGTNEPFTITPAFGYQVAGVSVDSAPVGIVTTYTFANVTANHTITANFSAVAVLAVARVFPVASVTVDNGTPVVNITLPTTVIVALSNGTTKIFSVIWNTGSYDSATPGTYTFVGTLTLPSGVTNPNNLTASVNVIVTPVQ